MKKVVNFFLTISLCLLAANSAFARLYYVNSHMGSDQNDGSAMSPLRTMTRLNGLRFQPGDKILFSKGCVFTGLLYMKASGTAEKPIVIASYGTGEKPMLSNPGSETPAQNVILVSGNYVIIRNIRFGRSEDAYRMPVKSSLSEDDRRAASASLGAFAGSITQAKTANHLDVTDCDFYNCKIGVSLSGQHNLVSRNYFETVHAPGLADESEIAVVLSNSFAEIKSNHCLNIKNETALAGQHGGFLAVEGDANGMQVHDVKVLDNYLRNADESHAAGNRAAKRGHSLF